MPGSLKDSQPIVSSDPEVLGGVPVFAGTRVPVRTLIDYLESGEDLETFLSDFPTVSRAQAIAALDQAAEALASSARPS